MFFLGWLREWWRGERERRGLLRLLLAEIKHNEIVIVAIRESGTSLQDSPYLDALKTQTWDESREAAARLPTEVLSALASYYEPLEIFRTLKSLPNPDPDRTPRNALESFSRSFEPLREAVNQLLGLPKDRRENYERRTLRAQARAKALITDYLDRHLLWAPPLLARGEVDQLVGGAPPGALSGGLLALCTLLPLMHVLGSSPKVFQRSLIWGMCLVADAC